MKKLRVFFACVTSRLARLALRLFGRGGTALPGKAALRVYPGLMRELGRGVETVIITGTNGKTTTAGMLRHMLDKAGTLYFSNRSGANLTSGITAEFIENADLLGKPKKTLAVIECDEGNFPAVAAALQPRAVIVTNLFRDQLDRYGEVTHTRDLIASGIQKAPGAVLCLNADCSLTASLGWDVPNKTVYFGLENISSNAVPSVSDAPHCLRCGARYAYRRYTFAHLGDWYCPACGAQRPAPDMAVESVEALPGGGSAVTMKTPEGTVSFDLALPALYNVCNAAADGTDVSWIWDADYESLLAARRYASIGVYGVRAQDMRLRLKYAGADDAAITVYDTADDLAAAVQKAGKPVVVLPNYTSMLTVRDKLSELAGGGRFWE